MYRVLKKSGVSSQAVIGLALLVLVPPCAPLATAQAEPLDGLRLRNHIRQERFDNLLADAMRRHGIDMWVHVIKPGDLLDLGAREGYCVFTDRGDAGIERAIFDYNYMGEDRTASFLAAYEIEGGEVPEPSSEQRRFHGLGAFVAARDPARIAVNYSARLPLADGLSYTEHAELTEELGAYAERLESAEPLIVDFLSRRVTSENVLFGRLTELAAQSLDREFARVRVGVTTLAEIPGNVFVRHRDGSENNSDGYVLREGDLLVIAQGASLGTFDAGIMHFGYVLKAGEERLPPELERLWSHSMAVRELLRRHIKSGPTARETLETLVRELERAGYHYNPVDRYDAAVDPPKTQVHLDLHAMGRGIDIPRISPLSADWALDLEIPPNHGMVFEYMVHMPLPELGKGGHAYLNFHDSAIVTQTGVEFPYPPVDRIRLLR